MLAARPSVITLRRAFSNHFLQNRQKNGNSFFISNSNLGNGNVFTRFYSLQWIEGN